MCCVTVIGSFSPDLPRPSHTKLTCQGRTHDSLAEGVLGTVPSGLVWPQSLHLVRCLWQNLGTLATAP